MHALMLIRRAAPGLALLAVSLDAQVRPGPGPDHHRLGSVHFETSCSRPAGEAFDRAMALLHSFEFGPAIRAFEGIAAADSACAMAWWGVALATWTNPMVPNIRPAAVLARGEAAVARAEGAARATTATTPRERAYVAAVAELYRDGGARDQASRQRAYERAMAALSAQHPSDVEARILHAIAQVAIAAPTDTTHANQLRAGAVLESLFVAYPEHPGLAHYIIHAYDTPALAARAAAAAARYAEIAPAASHALHMPSHTFTRIGDWRASAATNLRSMDAAIRDGAIAEALHAMDYAVYADLQLGRDGAVDSLVARLPGLRERFDPNKVTGAAPGSAGVFALAAIPARLALERDDWAAASALAPRASDFPYTEALTWFARALGRAHGGDLTAARAAADTLEAIERRLRAAGEANWADQVLIHAEAARAWIAYTAGDPARGVSLMRAAAAREDRTEKPAVTPGPLLPARELLGDMLAELGRPAEALETYGRALQREPNRQRALRGAVRAARAAGDPASAARYEAALTALRTP